MNTQADSPSQAPSKTQKKREMLARQALGERLIACSPSELHRIPVSDDLREAVLAAQHMRKHGALQRQRQYIGRLMREVDPEPITDALDHLEHRDRESASVFRSCERWRDFLLTEADCAVAALAREYPQVDRQHLRRLVEDTHRERNENRPRPSSRELFRYLHEILKASGSAGDSINQER